MGRRGGGPGRLELLRQRALTDAELDEIALYLNFDMVGSPELRPLRLRRRRLRLRARRGRTAPTTIEDVFSSYFAANGLATEPTAFNGRSDYQAFINNGIPAGGLFTGAEGIKTAEQAAICGGTPARLRSLLPPGL